MINTSQEMSFRLDNLNAEQRRISYQMSTGKKLDNGSDDSVTYSKVIQIEDRIKTFDGIKTQLEKATAQHNSADSTIDEIKKLLEKTKSELIKANTATTDSESRKAIALGLEGLKENILMFANEQIDGQYLFSGSDATVKPFEKDDTTGKVVYNGDSQLRKLAVEDGVYRERGVSGFDMMMYPKDIATKADPNLSFTENERIIDQDGYEWKLNSAKTDLVRHDSNGNATTDTLAATNDSGTPVTYTVNIGNTDGQKFEAKTSIFDLLDSTVNALNAVDSDGNPISEVDAKAAISNSLDEISNAFDGVNIAHAKLGARNAVFENAYERVSSKVTQFNIMYQDVGAADLSKVAVEAKALELTYTALYSTINKTNQLSLVNFLN